MILVGQFDSPFVRRVAVTLRHYGVPFSRNTASVFTDAAEMQRINPLIRIPSLILESGETLIDSGAIVDYLDETEGRGRRLVPTSGPHRCAVAQIVAIAAGAAEKAGQITYERYFHPGNAHSADWDTRCNAQLGAALDHLEARCGTEWFFAEGFSHADVMTSCMIGYLRLRVPEAFADARLPMLADLAARCEALEIFAQSAIGPDEVMPDRS
jgi:glutathione S-transferase